MNFVKELCRYNDLNRGVKNEITPTNNNNTHAVVTQLCATVIKLKLFNLEFLICTPRCGNFMKNNNRNEKTRQIGQIRI